MNEDILTASMMWSISDFSEETLIRDVKVLRGGYNLSYSIPRSSTSESPCIHIYQYWDVNLRNGKSRKEIKKVFKIHEDAVKIRTRSDVPIGIMLSGGLDSSVLVAEVVEHLKAKGVEASAINTYTSSYEGYPEGDERKFAESVNQYCGTKQNFVYPDEEDTFSVLAKMIWHTEGLAEFYSMGGFLTVREVSKTGIKVIFNGQGSDETMFGYERYYPQYLKDVRKTKGNGKRKPLARGKRGKQRIYHGQYSHRCTEYYCAEGLCTSRTGLVYRFSFHTNYCAQARKLGGADASYVSGYQAGFR